MNAAHAALTRAVNRALANGAPRFVNRNSFQQWAISYATPRGFAVTETGNWVSLARDGVTVECMTEQGVRRACQEA